jgi:hypothetical protein
MTLDFILHYVVILHGCVVAMIRPSHTLIDMTYCRAEAKATPASVQGVIWISLLRIDLKPIRNSSARFGSIFARKDCALHVRCTLRMRFCAS